MCFLVRLLHYDVENIKESVIEKIQPYVKDKSFRPAEVCGPGRAGARVGVEMGGRENVL